VSRIRKKTFYIQCFMGTTKKLNLIPQKWKKAKIRMEATRRRLKSRSTPNLPISTNIFPKKVCLVPEKRRGAKNSYGTYPTEFAGSTQNPKNKFGTPNIPFKTKMFLKKLCFVFWRCKGPKNSFGSYSTEFAGSPQNLKKMSGTPNLPIRTKNFPKE
jgi:hypothetical protein